MRAFTLWILASFMVLSGHAQSVTPDTAAIVTAYDAYDQKPNRRSRRDLMRALEAYSGDPTTETVRAHLKVLGADSRTTKYRNLRESALATTSHLETVKEILPRPYIEARYLAAIALFNWRHDDDAIIEMAHVQGLAQQAHSLDESTEWAKPLRYKAEAWRMAMGAYFTSTDEQQPPTAEIAGILAQYSNLIDSVKFVAVSEGEPRIELRFCSGTFEQKPAMRYPSGAARKNMFGALIIKMSFGDDGRVENPEILASVPIDGFEEEALRTVQKWRYKAADGERPGETCRLSREHVILPLVFDLGG